MHAHNEPTSLENFSPDMIIAITNWLDVSACIRFLLTTKNLHKILMSNDALKILCFANIITAITTTDDLQVKKAILNDLIKKDVESLKKHQNISLYYENYRRPLKDESHFAFVKPLPFLPHKLWLTCEASKKNNPNSSLQSHSLFKIPLTQLDKAKLEKLCSNQIVEYHEALPKQPVRYIPTR